MKIMCHKKYLFIIISLVNIYYAIACGPHYDVNSDYYNLFLQEIIDDKQYEPFLLTFGAGFYYTDKSEIKNENIEEWQEYFGISYDDALYLVFDVSENTLNSLLSGEKVTDSQLDFITKPFIKKYRKALEYLVYAKYLEPYMHIIVEDSWYYTAGITVKDLNYDEVVSTLKSRWKKTKDKELKLRYGYQLVRFAHYNRKYEEAISFFDNYVEVLNFKPPMYYHALSQKAGAERGNGDISLANYHFLQVFANSKNLKEIAVNSIRITDNVDWAELVSHAKTKKEISDAYLLLGYNTFNNPLNEIAKIIENDPDAVQAKVLMVRAINLIERKDLDIYFYYSWYNSDKKVKSDDKRFPQMKYLSNDIIDLSDAMTKNPAIKDKNFWYITSAYLHFLNKDFVIAKSYLSKVEEINDKYTLQKQNLALFIDVSELPLITPESEIELYKKYNNLLGGFRKNSLWDGYLAVSTSDFVRDVLANRYFLQKDYAKSFLLNNQISELEENPRLDLLDLLEEFYYKPDKNPMEEYIAQNYYVDSEFYSGMNNYLDFMRGVIYLNLGNLSEANLLFQKIDPSAYKYKIPDYVFGVNIDECFNCPPESQMIKDYVSDFPFIKEKMDYSELTVILMELEKIGKKNNTLSSKANYLLGNFFYNISLLGYYRNISRFNTSNHNNYRYHIFSKPGIYDGIYFKNYSTFYNNSYQPSKKYLELAYKQATNRELKARIVFALSKSEQGEYVDASYKDYYSTFNTDNLISDRRYFKELMKYRNTNYFKEVESRCKFFEYYVENATSL